MKKIYSFAKGLLKDRKGVFGLTSVQQFFAVILGLGLLAYVIVVIMGVLSGSTILPASSLIGTVRNESGWLNSSGYLLAQRNVLGFSSPVITAIINATNGALIPATNYTLTGSTLRNATVMFFTVNVSYTYSYNSQIKNDADTILSNTSGGISSFFGNVSPVYAILAILVIILVLVVLVRVVTGGDMSRRASEPQL